MSGVLAVLPARFGSSRFPGKPLKKIAGKELIVRVIEGVKTSKLVTRIVVATDHLEIFAIAQAAGAQAVMTDSDLPSGTDRVWQAAKEANEEIILNIQGDEPLTLGQDVDSLAESLLKNSELEMATLGHEISLEELSSPNSVKVLRNRSGHAIYFSRLPIPYSRAQDFKSWDHLKGPPAVVLKHMGMYGFRRLFLKKFCETPVTGLEESESLEQLRALYLGAKIQVLWTESRSWGVDVPEDIQKIEKILRERGLQ